MFPCKAIGIKCDLSTDTMDNDKTLYMEYILFI